MHRRVSSSLSRRVLRASTHPRRACEVGKNGGCGNGIPREKTQLAGNRLDRHLLLDQPVTRIAGIKAPGPNGRIIPYGTNKQRVASSSPYCRTAKISARKVRAV